MSRRGLAARALLVVALSAGTIAGLSALGVDVRHLSPEQIRATVLSYGPWALLAYLVIFGQPIVPLPGSAMIALAGIAFGKAWGAAAALAGATLRAAATFALVRLLGPKAVTRLFGGPLARLHQKLGRHAFKTVLLIRLVPNVPFDMQNYALSFSRVEFSAYIAATALGLIPASVAYAALGDSLTDMRQFWKVLGAVLLVAGLVAAQQRWARRKRQAGIT